MKWNSAFCGLLMFVGFCDDSFAQTFPTKAWEYREGRDQMTDLPTASMRVKSVSGNEMLIVACQGAAEPVVTVQFLPKKYLGIHNAGVVQFRFDETPQVDLIFEHTARGAFVRDESIVRVLGQLLEKSVWLNVRAWDYEHQPVDGRFYVMAGAAGLREVFRTCRYSFDDPSLSPFKVEEPEKSKAASNKPK